MKNKIRLYLTLWVVLFAFSNANSQCEVMKFFKDDMYTSKELVAFAEKDPQKAFNSWKVLYNEKTHSSSFIITWCSFATSTYLKIKR